MALLTEDIRKKYFETLGLGAYNKTNIKKLQSKYMARKSDADGIYGQQTDNLLRHMYNVKKYTKNFQPEEFKCECNGRYCCGYPTFMKPAQLTNLQTIRDHYKKPMTVTSGMRCTGYNNAIGGSIANSKHLIGQATDFYMQGVTDTLTNRKAFIKYGKTLPNTTYIYGNGINSYGNAIYAPYMGNAIHYDTSNGDPAPKPTPSGKLTVDGIGGTATVERMQEFFGTNVDGVISGQNKAQSKYYPNLTAVSYGTGGSPCIKNLQRFVGATQDGIIGQNTVKALQKKLGIKNQDGIWGENTMKAWQVYLNNNDKPVYPPAPKPKKSIKIIDVSEFQDVINWNKAKADGIKGAIVRCGFRGATSGTLQTDAMFLNHIKGAYKAGLPVGIYMFTEAINAKEGKEEAEYAIKLWQTANISISFPIAVDTEDVTWKEGGKTVHGRANATKLSKTKRTEAIKAFCEQIKAKGYKPMIYASTSWLNNQLDMSKLPYDVWVAQYHSTCEYKGKYIIWQYTSEGKVAGAKGNIDLNHCYIEPKKVNPPEETVKKGYTGEFPNIYRTQMLIDEAKRLAWAKDTESSKYKYPSGSATQAFKKALDKAYPNRGSWGKAAKVGASCDVFVGTSVRSCGLDSDFPRGLREQFTYKPKSCDRFEYMNAKPIDKSKDGDIVMFEYADGGHIVIRGNGYYYEANYETYFGHTNTSLARLKKSFIKVVVLRPHNYLKEGDTGAEVKKLKDFLIWYGFKLDSNTIFSENTTKAVKKFQKEQGLKEDGIVGEATLNAMKKVKK